jgi:hypothetical protein
LDDIEIIHCTPPRSPRRGRFELGDPRAQVADFADRASEQVNAMSSWSQGGQVLFERPGAQENQSLGDITGVCGRHMHPPCVGEDAAESRKSSSGCKEMAGIWRFHAA